MPQIVDNTFCPALVRCFSGLEFGNIKGLLLILFNACARGIRAFYVSFAVLGPFTAGNSETSRCYFAVPVSTKQGILRLTVTPSLFFAAKTAKTAASRSRISKRDPEAVYALVSHA